MGRLTGLIGVAVILLIGYVLCPTRRRIDVRMILAALIMQFLFAWMCLSFPPFVRAFDLLAEGFNRVVGFADEGANFVFSKQLNDQTGPWGFIFAVRVLPTIIFFASLMAVLYHLRLMQPVVAAIAWLLRRSLRVTGVEALSAAANIFLGQTEAPLCVKPYIATMTRAQLMAVMVPGFSSIAGSVLAAYIGILGGNDVASRVLFAKHLMTASLMSAPAGLLMARLMLPETETPPDEHLRNLTQERATRNVIDAAASGAAEGLQLALNVGAMLIAFVALLAMLNWPLQALSLWEPVQHWREAHGVPVLSFQVVLGYLLAPLAWTMGVDPQDCRFFGGLLGTQVIATEFVAYLDLGAAIHNGTVSHRTAQIATYSLCGFANLPSIAIQIGGISGMAPNRRSDLAALGLRAMTAGALACWMAGAIAGLFIE
jgi:CNT family concentrative nucleoside transporter